MCAVFDENGLERTREILHHESGLTGLSGGKSDMRRLIEDPSPDAAFAIAHFTYWCRRHAGSLIAALEGLDAIAFTGGIGENAAPIRAAILDGLSWTGARLDTVSNMAHKTHLHDAASKVAIWIIPAEEERMIARDALALIDRNT